jgi:hypothetical protein
MDCTLKTRFPFAPSAANPSFEPTRYGSRRLEARK